MNKERLLKIAEHLEKGQLIHKHFDFNQYNSIQYNNRFSQEYNEKGCGTLGCAIGEFPAIFPNDWEFRPYNNFEFLPRIIDTSDINFRLLTLPTFQEAQSYLDISEREAEILFTPQEKHIEIGNEVLAGLWEGTITKEQVAGHIREFVRLKELNGTI